MVSVTESQTMKLLCKFKGGSHAYGLNTPASDMDWRGVFVNTDLKTLVGLNRHEHQEDKKDGKDEEFKEFRAFLRLLAQANSQAVEMLFLEDSAFDVLTDEFAFVRQNREKLLDSEKLFKCLSGYLIGELKLANGERTGKLGGKRKEAIDKYGFSPKNFVQLFRLAWAGSHFFQHGVFPVKVHSPAFHALLMNVKTNPTEFTKEQLNELAAKWDAELKKSFDNRYYSFKFDEDFANELCYVTYQPLINAAARELKVLHPAPPKVKV